ncbi:MAG: caspase family protein [Pirellulales bacterium]
MSSNRRKFFSSLLGIGSAAGIGVALSSEADAGWFCRRRLRHCCCTCCRPDETEESLANDPVAGFRDVPGTVNRVPDEVGIKEIVEIPTSQEKRGYALHLGVNWTDPSPQAYGSTNNLDACVFDAQDMRAITDRYGFTTSMLTNEHATTENLQAELKKASSELRAGDYFVLTYSGHGAYVNDETDDELDVKQPDVLDDPSGQPDGLDETLCLHDRMIVDDELYWAWKQFKQGVRILVVLDCCHSGTAVRSVESAGQRALEAMSGYGGASISRGLPQLDGPAEELRISGCWRYDSIVWE